MFWFLSMAQAATVTVGSGQTHADLASAVSAANPGDTVEVYAGATAGQTVIDKNLTITGMGSPAPALVATSDPMIRVDGAYTVTIEDLELDADGQGIVFDVDGGADVTLRNIDAHSGSNSGGTAGALLAINNASTVTTTRCAFHDATHTANGGLVGVQGGSTLTADRTSFERGTADGGGAILVDASTLTLDRSELNNNTGSNAGGGAIHATDSIVNLTRTAFRDNVLSPTNATYGGGALYCGPASICTVEDVIMQRNHASRGGGIHVNQTQNAEIRRTLFCQNEAQRTDGCWGLGGAVHVQDQAAASLNNNLFYENDAYCFGGAIQVQNDASAVSQHNSFVGNTASNGNNGSAVRTFAGGTVSYSSTNDLYTANVGGATLSSGGGSWSVDFPLFFGNVTSNTGGLTPTNTVTGDPVLGTFVSGACEVAPFVPGQGSAATGAGLNGRDIGAFDGVAATWDADGDGVSTWLDCDDWNANRGLPVDWWLDGDGDGVGAGSATNACTRPTGSHVDVDGDCDDTEVLAAPGLTEVCDGIDNDCDTSVDEGTTGTGLWYLDGDGDGYGDAGTTSNDCAQPTGYVAAAGDCNDADGSIHPGVTETCDTVDEDCNGLVDDNATGASTWYADTDNDNHGDPGNTAVACTAPAGHIADNTDCDDTEPLAWTGNAEVCDGVDNDCDGGTDLNATNATTWYRDSDSDGHGDPNDTVDACAQPTGYIAPAGDCDDSTDTTHPGATELCNSVDDDCNGVADDGATGTGLWYLDSDGDGFGTTATTSNDCLAPANHVSGAGDCDDSDDTIHPNAIELCDSVDENCDGQVDNNASDASTWYADVDGDGHGNPNNTAVACVAPPDFIDDDTDCNDAEPLAWDLADEVCDGVDNDCDGGTDLGASNALTWYADDDGDQYGDDNDTVAACTRPAGYVDRGGDCDDQVITTNPAAPEQCNGIDDDCNNIDDDGVVDSTWYQDDDGDGYGTTTTTVACAQPVGFGPLPGDCDDTDNAVNPAATEWCDNVDNDCDGTIDIGAANALPIYRDADGDGVGTTSNASDSCGSPPSGWTFDGGDCDDTDPDRSPRIAETCDGIDNDCDAAIDNNANDAVTLYADTDGDGFGDPGNTTTDCPGLAGWVTAGDDCNDTEPRAWSGADELCDGIDNDCNGDIDEGLATGSRYLDADGDGYGDDATAFQNCQPGVDSVPDGGDCDDSDPDVSPDGIDQCGDGVDQDCDGDDAACDSSRTPDDRVDGVEPKTGPTGCGCQGADGTPMALWWLALLWARRR